MPSPIGHALAAVAAGMSAAGRPADARDLWRRLAILAAIGVAPDLDLLVGRHSRETHSLVAAVLVATLAAAMRWPVATSRLRIWCTVALAWLSHPLLDALALDTSPPLGVMALWPLTRHHYQTGLSVFGPIARNVHQAGFWINNTLSVLRELGLLIPVALLVCWWRRRPGVSGPRSRPAGQ